ncbi:MAG: hypothetical protein ACTSRA_05865, partial [Promethearchaeota archaeon]
MGVAMYYFNKVMAPNGIRARDCFGHGYITKDVIKTSVWWGIQLSMPGMVGSALSFVNLVIMLIYLPQYQHWRTIADISNFMGGLITIGRWLSMKAAISESYMNGKPALAQYYFANSYKWYFTMMFLFLGIFIVYLPMVLEFLLQLEGAERYILAVPFVIPSMIWSAFAHFPDRFDDIIVGADHPTAKTLWEVGGAITGTIWNFFSLAVLQWHLKFGLNGMVFLFTFAGFAGYIAFLFIRWIFIEYYIFHIKIPIWQGIIAPLLSILIILPISYMWLNFVHTPHILPATRSFLESTAVQLNLDNPSKIASEWGNIIAGLITVAFALFSSLVIFFFLLGFFGGWDDFGFLIMLKVYHLSGPSKPIVKLILGCSNLGIKLSKRTLKLHSRFPIEARLPFIQSIELLIERQINDIITGFKFGRKSTNEKKKEKNRNMKPPRAYLLEFFKDFKTFFTKTKKHQWIGIGFSLAIYGIMLSPVFLIPLGSGFFDQQRAILTYAIYVLLISIVGVTGVYFARSWRLNHDRKQGYA